MSTMRLFLARSARCLVLAAGLLACASPAAASGSWRCGNRLVGTGTFAFDVLRTCGAPDDRIASVDFVSVRLRHGVDVVRAVPVEVWTYNLGPRSFVRVLTFRDRRLVYVAEGGYGW
ncbi:MAG TPA: DUF2845 domain-containing protein [Candidatus Binatia bacterium]|nr:DUF2845 domain-containing protein [Candidatus Binatia bacterium]